MRRPPALSQWLLEHVVSHDALAGDLAEEYASGRSSGWHLGQVLFAICVGASMEIHRHKWLTLRAIVVGWAFLVWWVTLFNLLSWKQWSDDPFGILLLAIPVVGFSASGWVVGRFHRGSMVLLFLVCIAAASALHHFGLTPDWLPRAVQPEGALALLAPVSIMAGGLLGSRSRPSGASPLRTLRVRG